MSSLLRSSSVMAAGTVLSRLTGMARDIALAAAIGTKVLGDTYTVANSLPNIVYALLVGGALSSVFIPQLVRHMKDDPDGGQTYAQRLLTLVTGALLVLVAAAVLAAPLVVDVYATDRWTSSDFATAVAFARYCLPQIFFYGLYAMFQQILNTRGSFGPPMFAPVLNNLVVIATCALFIAVTSDRDELATTSITPGEVALLGAGTTVGIAVQALCLVPALRRVGFRLRPRFDLRRAGLGQAGSLAKWTFFYVLVSQVGYAVVVQLATGAGARAQAEGLPYGAGVAAYAKAYMIFLLPHSVVTVSLVTALFPRMSSEAHEGRVADLRASVSHGLRLVGVAIVPASALLVALGPQVGVALYGYGQVGADGAAFIGRTLSAMALGLAPFCAFYLLNRGFYAQEDTRTPALVNVAVNLVNVALALALVAVVPVSLAVPALALSLAASYVTGTALLLVLLRRRLGGVDGRSLASTYLRLVAASVPAALLAAAVAAGLGGRFGEANLGSLLGVLAGGAVGAVAFVALAVLLRVEEVRGLGALVRARVRR